MTSIQQHEIRDFTFQNGTTLPSVFLAYTDTNPTASKTALVVSCFRGRLSATCTFSTGPLSALKDHRVVCVALFGNGESSGPSNRPGFPQATVGYRDCVRAQRHLLTALGIGTLDVVVGFSMGGQTAYHWTLMYPDMVKHAVVLCSSARTSRHNIQFLEGPRAALEHSIDYVPVPSRTTATPRCVRGLKAFGKAYSAWLASADWFDQEQYKKLGFSSREAWDEVITGKNYDGWDPDDLLTQLGMWQRGDLTVLGPGDAEEGVDQLPATLATIKARVLLMPSRSDQYFKWEASERESKWIPDATLKVIPSIWGHMAGIGVHVEDATWIDQQIHDFLKADSS